MRDWLAAAQDDRLEGEKFAPSVEDENTNGTHMSNSSKRVGIPRKRNLCFVRSGHVRGAALPAKQKLCLESMHPVLIRGRTFFGDKGKGIEYYANNFWDVIDSSTYETNLEKT